METVFFFVGMRRNPIMMTFVSFVRWKYGLLKRAFTPAMLSWINTNRLLFLLLALYTLALSFGPPLPNVLHIGSSTAIITTLSAVAGSLSAILGIVVAVVLVGFELSRRTYRHYASELFFSNVYLRQLIVIYSFTVASSLVTLSAAHEHPQTRDYTLTYIALYLTTIALVFLFPYLKIILSSAQSKDQISTIVRSINRDYIDAMDRQERRLAELGMAEVERNPLFILAEIGIRAVEDNEELLPRFLLNLVTVRLIHEITGDIYFSRPRVTLNAFLPIYEGMFEGAIKNKKDRTAEHIINMLYDVHVACAKAQIPGHNLTVNSRLIYTTHVRHK